MHKMLSGYLKRKIMAGSTGGSSTVPSDVTLTGTEAARPAAGTAGRLYLPNDGFAVERDNAAAWDRWGPLYPFTAPPTAGWSSVNAGAAMTASQARGGIMLTKSFVAADDYSLYVRTAPATPYTISIAFSATFNNVTACACGLVWRESGSGKFEIMQIASYAPMSWLTTKYNSPTSANSNRHGTDWPINSGLYMQFFRIVDDGVNRQFFHSGDGLNWVAPDAAFGRTDFCTPDQVGIGIQSNSNGHNAYMTLHSWLETSP